MAAHEPWDDGTTVRLLLVAGRGMPPRRLLSTRRSAAGWVAVKELEKMTPAIGSTEWLDP